MPVFINCSTDFNVTTDANSATRSGVTWTVPTATDNTGTVAVAGSESPGMTYAIGDHQVTYTATDSYSNQAFCTFTISVLGKDISHNFLLSAY